MKNQLFVFLIRWLLSSLGLFFCVKLFGSTTDQYTSGTFLLAGLFFSLANSIVKPFITILSLPLILLSVGLFTLVLNGLLVYISIKLTPGVAMGFWGSFASGLVLSLINYIVNITLQPYNKNHESR